MKKTLSFIVALALLQSALFAQQAPDFIKTDCNGVSHHLYGDLAAGNAVILNFCAGWCGACRYADPLLEDLYQKYCHGTGKVKVYGMLFESNFPALSTDCAFGQYYAAAYGLTYPIFTNIGTWKTGLTGQYDAAFNMEFIPTFYVIIPNTANPANSTVHTIVGYSEEIEAVLIDNGFGHKISVSNTLCSAPPYSATLTSNIANGNLWSTGATTQSITVHDDAIYTLTNNVIGCNVTMSENIEFRPVPVAGTASIYTLDYSFSSVCTGGQFLLVYTPGNAEEETWVYRYPPDATWYDYAPAAYGPILVEATEPPGTVIQFAVRAKNGSTKNASCVAYSNMVFIDVNSDQPGAASGTASSSISSACYSSTYTVSYSGNELDPVWQYYDVDKREWVSFAFADQGPVEVVASDYSFTVNVGWQARLRVKIASGNCYLVSNEITVGDTEPPSISCPSNIVRSTDPGFCGAEVSYVEPTFSDNCPYGYIYRTNGGRSGSIFPKGVTVVRWRAGDFSGLTSECTFTVTVVDAQAPSISCPASQTVGNTPGQCYATATYLTPTGSDNCDLPSGAVAWVSGGSTPTASGANSASVFPKGATTVTWKVTDGAGLTKTCSFRVTVNDIQAPTFTLCPSSQSVSAATNACSASATYATPTATDNCTFAPTVVRIGGLPSNSAFPLGTTTVIWRAIDGAGRSSTCTFTVTVTDNAPPAISCPANIVQNNPPNACNAPVMYTTPTATDNCGVNAVFLMSGAASGSAFPLGTTAVTWQANDVNGLSATCSFSVTVSCGAYRSTPFGDTAHGLSDVAQRSPGPLTVAPNGVRRYVLSPNPATEMVDVAWDGSAPDHVVVFDAQGRLVWEQATDTEARALRFDVSDWTAGVYLVSLRSGGTVVVKRLVVCKDL